jgi:hypothetical protein
MSDMKRREFITREFFARVFDLCTREIGPPVIGSIQNNCEFRLFYSRHQTHAFSKPNPRKPAFPCINLANCKTYFSNIARR